MSKFNVGDKVRVLPFKMEGKRNISYDDEMLLTVGSVGVVQSVSSNKPKYHVYFYHDDNGESHMIDWFFYSSDLELVNEDELGEHVCL